MVYKKHYVIIFGGMSQYNPHFKTRECLNSVALFSPLTRKIK